MPEFHQIVYDKITEYDFKRVDFQPSSDEELHVIVADEAVIFIKDKEKTISISFQVNTKPEIAATDILILKQIPSIKNIDIMDSYIFTGPDQMVSGDEAFDLLYKKIKTDAIREYANEKFFENVLENAEGYRC